MAHFLQKICLLLFLATNVLAITTKYYLRIIDGSGQSILVNPDLGATPAYRDLVEVTSWSWLGDDAFASSAGGGGAAVGRFTPSALNITRVSTDKNTLRFFHDVALHTAYNTLQFFEETTSGNGVVTKTFQYTLTSVYTVHLSHVHIPAQPTRIIEYLQFRYSKFAITIEGSTVTYDVTSNMIS